MSITKPNPINLADRIVTALNKPLGEDTHFKVNLGAVHIEVSVPTVQETPIPFAALKEQATKHKTAFGFIAPFYAIHAVEAKYGFTLEHIHDFVGLFIFLENRLKEVDCFFIQGQLATSETYSVKLFCLRPDKAALKIEVTLSSPQQSLISH